jgi:hypothetical protein
MLEYLKGLDVYARLDIVAIYLDQDMVSPGMSTLYVLARSHGSPRKYYFRTLFADVWSAWTPVTPDIEGDHVTLAVWRGRLHVLWVTFIGQPQSSSGSLGSGVSTSQVSAITFDMLDQVGSNAQAQARQQLQLHRAEYIQGKWSHPVASDLAGSSPIAVSSDFDPTTVRIRVSKETAADGSEGALDVHLDFARGSVADLRYTKAWRRWHRHGPEPLPNYLFRLTGRNSHPQLTPAFSDFAPPNPYNATVVDATMLSGSGSLSATFADDITSSGSFTSKAEPILNTVNNYAIVPCANPIVPSPFLSPTLAPHYAEAGSLVAPFFYKDTAHPSTDNELTFYVQPSLTETQLQGWQWWAVPVSPPLSVLDPKTPTKVTVVSQVPVAYRGPQPQPPEPDPVYSIYQVQDRTDWATTPATVFDYGGVLVNQVGGVNVRAAATSLGGTVQGAGVAAEVPVGAASDRTAAGGPVIVGAQGLTAVNATALARGGLANFNLTAGPVAGSTGGTS